ncbi:lipid II flippase MurJ [Streptomyces sp. SKN60]|uniref:lipid II flippase MurJ n=1 Tax=Streptomyces sp. SKN60 TaxID=2855506 RepID=UPI0035ABF8D9
MPDSRSASRPPADTPAHGLDLGGAGAWAAGAPGGERAGGTTGEHAPGDGVPGRAGGPGGRAGSGAGGGAGAGGDGATWASDTTLQLRLPYGRADRTPPLGPGDPWSLLAPEDPLCDLPAGVPGGDGARGGGGAGRADTGPADPWAAGSGPDLLCGVEPRGPAAEPGTQPGMGPGRPPRDPWDLAGATDGRTPAGGSRVVRRGPMVITSRSVPGEAARPPLLGGRPLGHGARPAGPPEEPSVRARHARRRTKWSPSGRFLLRAAAVTAVLTAVGAVLGLVRDQILAGYFGAGAETDAFLVAWTVPEFASTLLIEDAMALILVPAFSRALARRAGSLFGDPVRTLVRATLPRLVLGVAAASALLVFLAPWLVSALAPGLPDPKLAVDCTRLTATCVLSFALAGYCSAALRAHGSFLPPAAIYVAYNVGIIGTTLVLREPLGVRSAAAGVAVGGVLMVLVQAPSLLRELRSRPVPKTEPKPPAPGGGDNRLLVLGMIAPVVVFALTRQSQILIERFLASPLPAGAISHLNYAQKVAQMPMILSLMLCTVSFPIIARALAAGDAEAARRRVERDLLLAAVVVLIGASTVIAAAPQIVGLLFERGAFDTGDTAATAAVMRVYALGLLGQTMVGALVRCYFSAVRPLWYPAAAMGAGLAATAVTGAGAAHLWGAAGIAGANAFGITLTAVMLLLGAHRQSVPVDVRRLGEGLLRLATAGAWATGAGWLCSVAIDPPLLSLTVAALVVVGVFLLFVACAAKAPEIPPLPRSPRRTLRPLRRTPHARPSRAASSAAEASPVGRDVPLDRGRTR